MHTLQLNILPRWVYDNQKYRDKDMQLQLWDWSFWKFYSMCPATCNAWLVTLPLSWCNFSIYDCHIPNVCYNIIIISCYRQVPYTLLLINNYHFESYFLNNIKSMAALIVSNKNSFCYVLLIQNLFSVTSKIFLKFHGVNLLLWIFKEFNIKWVICWTRIKFLNLQFILKFCIIYFFFVFYYFFILARFMKNFKSK